MPDADPGQIANLQACYGRDTYKHRWSERMVAHNSSAEGYGQHGGNGRQQN